MMYHHPLESGSDSLLQRQTLFKRSEVVDRRSLGFFNGTDQPYLRSRWLCGDVTLIPLMPGANQPEGK